jgi:hypothetical protein
MTPTETTGRTTDTPRGPRRLRRRAGMLLLLTIVLLSGPPRGAAASPQAGSGLDVLSEARKLYDAQDYTGAIPLFNQAIAKLDAQASTDSAVISVLVTAFEMRARCKAFKGDWEGARADFKALLERDPQFDLPASTSPRIKSQFADVKKLTVADLLVSVAPVDAQVEVDGKPFKPKDGAPMPFVVGSHTVTARRLGYAPLSKTFVVAPATPGQSLAAVMERTSAVVRILTVPAGVEVVVDGASKGTTPAGPAPQEFVESLQKLGATAAAASAPLVLGEIGAGAHVVEFRKDCYVTMTGQLQVQDLKDYTMEPQVLSPSVATLKVEGDQAGLAVYLDGEQKGTTPATIESICQGSHTVDVRASWGRFIKRLDLKTGDNTSLKPAVRPTFAVLSVTGLPQGLRGGPDLRQKLEQTTQDAGSVMFYSPPADTVRAVLQKAQLDEGWLAFDRNHRPINEAAAKVAADARIELSTQLAAAFNVQGVATIAQVPGGNSGQVYVSMLAAGSGEPDVLYLDVNDQASKLSMLAQLEEIPSRFVQSVGLLTIDVMDREGAIVARVDAGGSGAAAGIQAGDIIRKVDRQPVANGSAFATTLLARKAGQKLNVEYRNRAGEVKTVDLSVVSAPRVVPMTDQTVLFNKLLLDYRARLAAQIDPVEQSVVHLNAGMALIALGNWTDARKELDQVKLSPGRVSTPTVQYLLGLCAEGLGQISTAESLWRLAATSPDAWLTDEGPELKELIDGKLAQLNRLKRR